MYDFIIFNPETMHTTLVTTESAAINIANALKVSGKAEEEEVFVYKLHCVINRAPSPQLELPL